MKREASFFLLSSPSLLSWNLIYPSAISLCFLFLTFILFLVSLSLRSSPFSTQIPLDSRLHQSYSNPKTCHPLSTRNPSSRSSRNGKDWFRKDFSLSNSSTSFSKWSSFLLFRNQSLSHGSF